MTFLVYTVSLKTIQAIFFFQNGDFQFSQVATSVPTIFAPLTAYLTPEPPIFLSK